jgi:hypothetical protein
MHSSTLRDAASGGQAMTPAAELIARIRSDRRPATSLRSGCASRGARAGCARR